MRGNAEQTSNLSSYLSPDERVPADHPLRSIREMTDEALRRLSARFDAIYAAEAASGRLCVCDRRRMVWRSCFNVGVPNP